MTLNHYNLINTKSLMKHYSLFMKILSSNRIEKVDECKNNPKNSSTTKVSENISSAFSISTMSSFRSKENKHDVYRSNDCMKNSW